MTTLLLSIMLVVTVSGVAGILLCLGFERWQYRRDGKKKLDDESTNEVVID